MQGNEVPPAGSAEPAPRVISLLPSATEILCAVGGAGLMVGRSHECDFPGSITHLPMLTGQVHQFVSSKQMNDAVSESLAAGKGLYTIDRDAIEALRPDVILTQSLCNVCSVDLCMVEKVAAAMKAQPEIVSLNPNSIHDLLEDMLSVGEQTGLREEAVQAVAAMQRRITRCLDTVRDRPHSTGQTHNRPKVAFVEWLDPIFVGGHWTPALIHMAGGVHPLNLPRGQGLAASGGKSFAVPHTSLVEMDPDLIIICPCGLDLKATAAEADAMFKADWWRGLRAVQGGQVAMVDGNQMFNRPGPRLVDALEFLTGLLNNCPEVIPEGFPWQWWRGGNVVETNGSPTGLASEVQASKQRPFTPHPPLDLDIEDAYLAAIEASAPTYTDPKTGYSVFVDTQLRGRGFCCGNRCRHCPYGHFNVNTELRGPRLNCITAPTLLSPHKEDVLVGSGGDEGTLLVWLGGLESHLALQKLLEQGVNPASIALLVAVHLARPQLAWGQEGLPLHDVQDQCRALGINMVVVPVSPEAESRARTAVPPRAEKVLQASMSLLHMTSCKLAFAVENVPALVSGLSDGQHPVQDDVGGARTWHEACSSSGGRTTPIYVQVLAPECNLSSPSTWRWRQALAGGDMGEEWAMAEAVVLGNIGDSKEEPHHLVAGTSLSASACPEGSEVLEAIALGRVATKVLYRQEPREAQ